MLLTVLLLLLLGLLLLLSQCYCCTTIIIINSNNFCCAVDCTHTDVDATRTTVDTGGKLLAGLCTVEGRQLFLGHSLNVSTALLV